jgi:hypothetical protein
MIDRKKLRAAHSGSIETCYPLKEAAIWVRQHLTWTGLEFEKTLKVRSCRDVIKHLKANGLKISEGYFDHTNPVTKKKVFRWDLL